MKIVWRVIAFIIIIPGIFLLWLGMTESGLHWSFQHASHYLPAELKLASLQGHLFGVMRIKDVEYKQDDVLVKVKEMRVNWSPSALLVSNISVSELQLDSLSIVQSTSNTRDSASQNINEISLPDIYFPWRISINNAVINNFSLQQNNEIYLLDKINVSASTLFNQLDINKFTIQSKAINLYIKGNFQLAKNYQHQLKTRWKIKLPSGEIVSGEGSLNGNLKTTILKQELNHPMRATLQTELVNLISNPQWQANLIIPQFEIKKIAATAPAILTKLSIQGNGDLTTANLEGMINGKHPNYPQPIDALLKLQLKNIDKGIDITKLELTSVGTQFNLHGQISKQLNLDWSLSVSELAELYSQAKGKIDASGSISGSTDTPIIKANYKAGGVSLADYSIASVEGSLNVDIFQWKQSELKLRSKNINIKGYALQAVNVNKNAQQLTIKAVTDMTTAFIEITGKEINNGWQGQVKHADIQSKQFNHWKLKKPVAFNIDKNTFMIDTICWVNPNKASMCAALKNKNKQWQSNLVLNKIPLSLISPWLATDINFNGLANATAEIQYKMPNQILGSVKVQLPAGSISYPVPDGDHEQWKYQNGSIDIILNDEGLNTVAEVIINKDDKLHLKADLKDFQLLTLNPQKQSISVQTDLRVHDLGFLEVILPEVQDFKGEVALSLFVSGTLAQPKINGRAKLNDSSLRIPRLGLTLSNLKLSGNTDNLKRFNFHLDAHSGEGNIVIQGQTILDHTAGWPTELSLKGEQFEVSRIPEARVVVSPDLKIKLHHNAIDVRGKVEIPYAKLQPKDVTTAARVSEDAIIIGNDTTPESKWSIVTKIRLILGDRVNFYGYGFEGRLGGSLLLDDEPGQLTKATGEINVPEGKYQAFGQNLTIQHGRLIYTGSPVNNPGLDLRAVRIINNITAGLKVTGSLTQPKIVLFSIPAMGQTNILSYLFMGAPIEKASSEEGSMMAKAALALGLSGGDSLARKIGDEFGLDQMRVESSDKGDQASLVMGRYLSPKLYVSYGVGLIESFNTFTVRYQLSTKWQIKAESGEAQGADILYTIER